MKRAPRVGAYPMTGWSRKKVTSAKNTSTATRTAIGKRDACAMVVLFGET